MKRVENLEQGSEEWLQYRRGKIGGSDAPVLMGASPFNTAFGLWEEKLGKRSGNSVSHYIHAKADTVEDLVRDAYNTKHACNMQDAIFEDGFLHASLDGYDETLAGAIEIKMANKEDHAGVRLGDIPHKYIWQVIHQLCVCPIQWVDYCSYYLDPDESDLSKGDLRIVRTYFAKSDELRKLYLEEAQYFWDLVQKKEPPEYTDQDWVPINEDDLKDKLLRLKFETVILKEKELLVKDLKAQINEKLDALPHKRYRTAQVKITRVEKKGSVDYKKAVETLGVSGDELDEFKRPDSSYYKFTFDSDSSQ